LLPTARGKMVERHFLAQWEKGGRKPKEENMLLLSFKFVPKSFTKGKRKKEKGKRNKKKREGKGREGKGREGKGRRREEKRKLITQS